MWSFSKFYEKTVLSLQTHFKKALWLPEEKIYLRYLETDIIHYRNN